MRESRIASTGPGVAVPSSGHQHQCQWQKTLPMRRQQRRNYGQKPKKKRQLKRPGRFFVQRSRLKEYRARFSPEDLGFADWLIYRRATNPYRVNSWAYKRYQKAYRRSKAERPKPDFKPLR